MKLNISHPFMVKVGRGTVSDTGRYRGRLIRARVILVVIG